MEMNVDGPTDFIDCQNFPHAKTAQQCARELVHDYERDYQCYLSRTQSVDKFVYKAVRAARILWPNFGLSPTRDLFSCSVCSGLMVDPVTLSCGHSFMKSCVPAKNWNCVECRTNYRASCLSRLKTSVTISAVLEKWWKAEMQSAEMCAKGNDLMRKGDFQKAIEMYSLALKFDSHNHLAARNRSKAYSSIGQSLPALNDIETAVRLFPSFEAYLQKGSVLVSLGRFYDAAVIYFECCILYSKSQSSEMELKRLLCDLLSKRLSPNSTLINNHPSSRSIQLEMLGQPRLRSGSDGSMNSTDISEPNSDDESKLQNIGEDITQDLIFLQNMFEKVIHELQQKKVIKVNGHKEVDASLIDKRDFECPLCMRLLWQPITTSCGHTFCRTCLDRCFDHQPMCPLCKTTLSGFMAERNQKVTSFIENAMLTLLPNDYVERKKIYEEELEELANAGKDQEHVIPLFICTIAFPTVPCPLHIFEPRYRLMIRRCMEAGTHSFGMCAYIADESDGIATIGTMLEIRDVQYFPDGRSLVDALGSKRFKILNKGMKDGYHTGSVEFLRDQPPSEEELIETVALHDSVRRQSEDWFSHLPRDRKSKILEHFGPMPAVETEYTSNPNGPAWLWWLLAILPLDTKTQLSVLGMTSLYRRLDALQKIILHIRTSNIL